LSCAKAGASAPAFVHYDGRMGKKSESAKSGRGKKTVGVLGLLIAAVSVAWFALRPRLQKKNDDL